MSGPRTAHDSKCEAEFILEAGQYTDCGCSDRAAGKTPEECPQPCEHLSQEDAREGRACDEHPCICNEREGL